MWRNQGFYDYPLAYYEAIWASRLSSKVEKSALREGYFLASRFNCLSKGGIERTL